MAKRNINDYYCNVINENVRIILKTKISIGPKYQKDSYVKCNQEDCQFVDSNASPCPLEIQMFDLPVEA
jgi:hypothetical protein